MGDIAGVAGGVMGAGGQIASGIIAKNAANRAGKQQSRALDKIRKFTEEQMDPALVAQKAKEQDIQRAKDRLELQAQIDPELAKQRGLSQEMITKQLEAIGSGESDRLAAITAKEAVEGVPGMTEAKKGLIDAALKELSLGAKLPPDVQAELMQAGLQQSGQVTGAAGGAAGGVGSSILNQVLGTAGLNLRKQRQTQAAELATAASNLESQRQQILQNLFPKLQEQQMQNLKATSGVLQQSNAMLPQAGLGGSDVASIWLSRVGALNNLALNKANVQSQALLGSATGAAQAWGAGLGFGQNAAKAASGGASSPAQGGFGSFFNSGTASAPATAAGADIAGELLI